MALLQGEIHVNVCNYVVKQRNRFYQEWFALDWVTTVLYLDIDPVFHTLLAIMRKATFDINDFTAVVLARKNLLMHEAVS